MEQSWIHANARLLTRNKKMWSQPARSPSLGAMLATHWPVSAA